MYSNQHLTRAICVLGSVNSNSVSKEILEKVANLISTHETDIAVLTNEIKNLKLKQSKCFDSIKIKWKVLKDSHLPTMVLKLDYDYHITTTKQHHGLVRQCSITKKWNWSVRSLNENIQWVANGSTDSKAKAKKAVEMIISFRELEK